MAQRHIAAFVTALAAATALGGLIASVPASATTPVPPTQSSTPPPANPTTTTSNWCDPDATPPPGQPPLPCDWMWTQPTND